jgi:hypothetical protein
VVPGPAVRVTVGELTGSGPAQEISSDVGGSSAFQPAEVSWGAAHEQRFAVLVQRPPPTNRRVVFDIVVDTNLSVLVTRPPLDTTLTCREETSGWGADDIALQLWADGTKVADIPNAVIGDFEDDSVRVVGDKLPALIPYVDRLELMVIEEDIGPDDVGRGTLPVVDRLAETDAFSVVHTSLDGRVKGTLSIGVDDGRYGFACVVSRWHPSL